MKADVVSNHSAESVVSSKKSVATRLRFLDLSFEGKDVVFKNDELDNGRFPHGGYKGSRKHPLGLYSFDKGRDFHRQLRDDLDLALEREVLGVLGTSPSWALEAHRWPTHTGESPLLAHGFLAASKLEGKNGVSKLPAAHQSTRTFSCPSLGPSSAGSGGGGGGGGGGVVYYRPNRAHPYLTATEFKDCADCDCEDLVRYGRPTRTTLLRARQKLNSSVNPYELRRQLEQRTEELKLSCAFSNPKEFLQLESEVDGETYYSFITGARYNRANCLDARSVTQHGVYMSRHNPLGCFVQPQKLDALDTTSAPPDSPRSDTEEEGLPARPITAPGQGRKLLPPHVPLPPPIPPPGQAWTEGAVSGDLPKVDSLEADVLRIRGSRVPINSSREGPFKFECRLPRLRQMREGTTDDQPSSKQPPPTPVPPYVKLDNSTVLPALREEPEAKADAAQAQAKTPSEKEKPEEEKTEEKEEKVEKTEEQKTEEDKPEEPKEEAKKEEEKAEVEEKADEKEEEETPPVPEGVEKEADKEETAEADTGTAADDTAEQRDVTEEKTSAAEEERPAEDEAQETRQEEPETAAATANADAPQREKTEDDVKFFVTEGVGVDDNNTATDVTATRTGTERDATEADMTEEVETGYPTEKAQTDREDLDREDPKDSARDGPELSQSELEAHDTDVDESGEQGQGQVEPLKVVVTHIERTAPPREVAPKKGEEREEEEEEVIAQHP